VRRLAAAIVAVSVIPLHARTLAAASRSSLLTRLTTPGVALEITRAGIYRVTAHELLAHGIDWSGIPASRLALVSRGRSVPRLVTAGRILGTSTAVEFVGQVTRTRYASENTYELEVDRADAVTTSTIAASPDGESPVTAYQARYVEAHRLVYDPLAHGDAWFFAQITSTGSPVRVVDQFPLTAVMPRGPARLTIQIRGYSDEPGIGPQHHLVVALNGHFALESRFSGNDRKTLIVTIPASRLHSGVNRLRFTVPGDVQNADTVDSIEIASWSITYPRRLAAEHGWLAATLPAAPHLTVSGFATPHITTWMVAPDEAVLLTGARVSRSASTFTLSLSIPRPGRFVFAGSSAFLYPSAVSRVRATTALLQGHANLLVIAPHVFIAALSPLLAYHRAHGVTVKVADPSDVFARYSNGVPDPLAVRMYIVQAHGTLGIRDVLLVGADTFDYHHYLACRRGACPANPSDTSFIPSFYVRDATDAEIPSDEAYVDGPSGPFAGIGRIPAVTARQLRVVISKTLNLLRHRSRVGSGPAARGALSEALAVLASGQDDPQGSFQATSERLAGLLPARYTVRTAYVRTVGRRAARASFLAGVARDPLLVDFVGHGNLEQWDRSPPLLQKSDVPTLHNGSSPGFFLGWGCQTAYHIDPTDASLNARLLFAPAGGAALTIGSTGFDVLAPQSVLATSFFSELFRGTGSATVGEALARAGSVTLATNPLAVHTVQSYELFGDPAVPVTVFRE
jgi:hypothetical protein